MPSLTQSIVIAGFFCGFAICAITIWRQRRFEIRDLADYVIGYIAGSNIPTAAFLCWYAVNPDPPSVGTKLQGFERYVGLAGLCLLVLSLVTLWGLLKNAYWGK